MNNPKRGFVVYFDNYPMLLALPPEQRGLLFTALMQYADGRWRTEPPDPRYSADLEQTRRLVERIRGGGV